MVMAALRNRMADQARQPNIRYTQAIVNQGREAGASLAHPHGQLLGMPFVPGEIVDEERAFARFEGGCILCVTAEAELADGSRVVVANKDVVVVCPFWSGTPYEMLVIPTRHEAHLYDSARRRSGRRRAGGPRRARRCWPTGSATSLTTSSSTPLPTSTTAPSTGTCTCGPSS